MPRRPTKCVIEPFTWQGLDFDELQSAAVDVCHFAFQRSRESGAPADHSYYGLDVESISQTRATELTVDGLETVHDGGSLPDDVAALPFKGGVFAYLPYDGSVAISDERHVFWLVRDLLILDHGRRRAFLSRVTSPGRSRIDWSDVLRARLGTARPTARDSAVDGWSHDLTFEEYRSRIDEIQDRIAAGTIQQAILSLGFSKPTAATAEQIFDILRRQNASPHVFLVRHGSMSLVGASPAMHLRKSSATLTVETDAGTRAVGDTEEATLSIERELLSSEKDLEEQRMIVDETIADLQAIAAGPVEVPVRLEVRRLGSVMHLFTVLEARLADGLSPIEAALSCFPPAAVTGAPRRAAMSVIRKVERVARGPYGGVVGTFGFDGTVDTAIVLRSAWIRDGSIHLRCGGGITHASVAEDEYAECMNKARSLQGCVADAEAFGTAGIGRHTT